MVDETSREHPSVGGVRFKLILVYYIRQAKIKMDKNKYDNSNKFSWDKKDKISVIFILCLVRLS